jgi:SagB-type dehydrogenase family enzyme
MSAVFARTMWKYPSSRAYRSILIDAGHLGQTFCLVATAIGLAPFCTMAFREADLDPVLKIDGVNESAVYIVGVGRRAENRRAGQIAGSEV